MQPMTPKQRMLAAYRGQAVDYVPVAPEFWYYLPARLLGVDMITFQREVPFWQALQQTFKHYGTEGWGGAGVGVPNPDVQWKNEWVDVGNDRFESRSTVTTPHGTLTSRSVFDREEPAWSVEHPIKIFEHDWPAYKAMTLGGVIGEANWSSLQQALDGVGEDYLLEAWVGSTFFDYIAPPCEGGIEQGLSDLLEHEEFFEALHEEYIDYQRRLTRAIFANTTAESVAIGCTWSCLSLISPSIWKRWDMPVIRAVADEAHAAGKLLHIHLHGRCYDILADMAECGADCICPFERPPGGDITDLTEVSRILGDKVTMNGNVHTVETLIRGTADDVRREVEDIFTQWRADKRRLIVGTGDQVGRETPDENIYAMVETARKLGRMTE